MREMKIVFEQPEAEPLTVMFPANFNTFGSVGYETSDGQRYCRVNWASTKEGYAFFYPFIGGDCLSLYCQGVTDEAKVKAMLKCGKFYKFLSQKELYMWMSGGAGC